MEAPGIRHNKECRKRFSEFEEQRRKERRIEPALSPESPVVVPQVQVPMQEVDDDDVVPTPESARRQPETQVEYTIEGLKGKLRPTENSWKERSVKILRNCFKQHGF